MRLFRVNYFVLFALLLFTSCEPSSQTLFQLIPPEKSNVDFINTITETEEFNILTEEYIYNGGGVAVADFNNDSLPDLYFTGNQVTDRLYLNKGNFKFEDVSNGSGIANVNFWSSGVSVVDINLDGLIDIYVSVTMDKDSTNRQNLLYINKGIENGIPIFQESAKAYGLNDHGNTTQSTFFDYDKDGDLDVYLLTNVIDTKLPGSYRPKLTNGTSINNDRLYRNNGDNTFTNVSQEAGIRYEGFGLGITVTDINLDNWPDIYITNDYLSNDLLYINNQDGTFSNKISDYIKHQSHSAMGNDIADLNNDGLADIFALDMLPETNERQKQMLGATKYVEYINNEKFGYDLQVVRNTLQLNTGLGPDGHPVFSEIGQLAGIHQTDWSWTPLLADFDNDGLRDIIITNGFPKDVTDNDFALYRAGPAGNVASKMFLQDSIPVVKISNYAFKNTSELKFKDITKEWGLSIPSFSNGAVYADLDLDGDLDIVTNNINSEPFIYENTATNNKNHFLRLGFEGKKSNAQGIGAKVILKSEGEKWFYEHVNTRGYLSSKEGFAHFGLGKKTKIDSLWIKWPDDSEQILTDIAADQVLILKQNEAYKINNPKEKLQLSTNTKSLLSTSDSARNISWKHTERDMIDFDLQRTIPRKFSQMGPAIAIGDVNNDGLEDFITGGSVNQSAQLFLQLDDGTFQDPVALFSNQKDISGEDTGLLLFDADNDNDLDLYIASGGFEYYKNSPEFQDKLYLNDGNGNFTITQGKIPLNLNSNGAVKAADYDGDGWLDLFVGGRVFPGFYPLPVASKILKNEEGVFRDITNEICPALNDIGMVSDALWTDFNNDGKVDLILAGEWTPLIFIENKGDKFEDITNQTGIAENIGWWNSLTAGDFDHDGDIDYIAGNLGLNSRYKATKEESMRLIANDFDKSNSVDPIISVYMKNRNGERDLYPVHSLKDMISQMQIMRKIFPRHAAYGKTKTSELIKSEALNNAVIKNATHLESSYIENLGNNKFQISILPKETQFAPIYGMQTVDVDFDGFLDVLMVGNDYSAEVFNGKYDALKGIVLKGDGKGNFKFLNYSNSGFFVDGDAKAMVMYQQAKNTIGFLISQNKEKLLSYDVSGNQLVNWFKPQAGDASVVFTLNDGTVRKVEIYMGSSYLSQSTNQLVIPENTSKIEVLQFDGISRKIDL